MPLSQQQLNELNIASARLGTANEGSRDRQNIDYAKRMFGYSYTPTQTQQVQNTQPVPQVLSSNLLNQNTQFNQVQQPASFDYNAFIKGLEPTQNGLQDFLKQYNTTETKPLQEERTGLAKTLQTSLDKLLGRSDRVAELTTQLDITGQQKSLNDLMKQIASSKANFDAQTEFVSGQPVSRQFMTGRQSAIQRQSAVELGGLSAMAEAVQGNIAASDALIARTITSEYQPVLDEITVLQEQLAQNYTNLSAAEKKRADEMNIILDERKRNIEVEAKNKESILTIAQTAAQNGADSVTLNNIIKSQTPEDATVMANKFLQTIETSLTEAGGRRLLINSRTGETIKDLGAVETTYQLTTDAEGNQIVFNPRTGETTTTNVSQGVVDGYDISSYATDPQHEQKVASIVQNMGQLTTPEEIDAYIQEVAPGSPITSDMIRKTSEKYGVSWEMLIAMMQQDSSLGTAGLGARNFNPGNIGQFDSLGTTPTKGYTSWQQGVDAVGNWLAKHKVAQTQTNAQKIAQDIFNGNSTLNVSSYPTKQREAIEKALTALKEEAKTSGDLEGIIKASAGGKDVAESFIQSFDKAANVVYQINDLQTIFDADKLSKDYTKQQEEETGVDLNPIWGKVRKFNPWDKNAQEIKAQLQAIVPNLARGIYGEVGVLTDNDIKNYTQTLPTLTSTEEVKKAVLGMTIRSVQRAIENKLKSQAASGRDVSGYLSMYQELKATADNLLGGFTQSGNQSTNNNDPLGLFN